MSTAHDAWLSELWDTLHVYVVSGGFVLTAANAGRIARGMGTVASWVLGRRDQELKAEEDRNRAREEADSRIRAQNDAQTRELIDRVIGERNREADLREIDRKRYETQIDSLECENSMLGARVNALYGYAKDQRHDTDSMVAALVILANRGKPMPDPLPRLPPVPPMEEFGRPPAVP